MAGRIRVKFPLAVLLLVAFACPVLSRQAASPASNSAKSIARLLEDHYRAARTLRAVFLERYSDGPHNATVESGEVYFRRPGRMRWEYESPEKKTFVSDGKTVWFYVPADHSVTRVPVKESTDWREPLALLTGQADLSRLCSQIEITGKTTEPAGHVILRCLPKGEREKTAPDGAAVSQGAAAYQGNESFTEVLLEVDSSSGELDRVEIRQPGGIELEYRFGGWQENMPLPEDMFRFQPPEGVAIVDGAALSDSLR